jgi:hypothetical protein
VWDELWNYQPPEELALLRKARREERARAPVELDVDYLLRAVEPRTSDTLTAFRVASILEDGSVVLVWRILCRWDPPEGTPPDLQRRGFRQMPSAGVTGSPALGH